MAVCPSPTISLLDSAIPAPIQSQTLRVMESGLEMPRAQKSLSSRDHNFCCLGATLQYVLKTHACSSTVLVTSLGFPGTILVTNSCYSETILVTNLRCPGTSLVTISYGLVTFLTRIPTYRGPLEVWHVAPRISNPGGFHRPRILAFFSIPNSSQKS